MYPDSSPFEPYRPDERAPLSSTYNIPDPERPVRQARPGGARARQVERERQSRQSASNPSAQGRSQGDSRRRQPSRKEKKRVADYGFVRFLRNAKTHAVVGGAMLLMALFIAGSAVSYIASGNEDRSILQHSSLAELAANPEAVTNFGGPVGARLWNSLFYEGVGIGAFVLIAWLSIMGWRLIARRKLNFWAVTFKSLLLVIGMSLIAGLIGLLCGATFNLGGFHGLYINLLLISYADWLGAILVSLFFAIAIFYVYYDQAISIYARYKSLRTHRANQLEERRQKEFERRERLRRSLDEIEDQSDDSGHIQDETPIREVPDLSFNNFDEEYPEPDKFAIPSEESVSAVETSMPNDSIVMPVADSLPELQRADKSAAEPEVSVSPAEPTLEVTTNEIKEGTRKSMEAYDPTAELSRYKMPPLDLLRDIPRSAPVEDVVEQKERITQMLAYYDITISHIHATVGPTVTLYEIIPAPGVKISKIKSLEDDIALNLAALGIRIIAPIPGKGTVGIEVPNKNPQTVSIRSILGSDKFQSCTYELPMAMGATISNDVYIADLAKMPHLLVAGATGMGKSVGLNTIIASLLYKKHPSELKFVLIDPKTVEFSLYRSLERHYLAKLPDEEEAVVTQMEKVLVTLNSLCVEMENRYRLLSEANLRHIKEYNERFVQRTLNPEKGHRFLPYIVVIVDEFADLIMTAGKEVEKPIARLAQKARAVGIHVILATQRPSTNVITGLIKANFPGRIAFKVAQMVDSKTILDRTGANQLIGRGDMLFLHNSAMDRVQCAFIDTPEVQAICDFIDAQAGYEHAYFLPEPKIEGGELDSDVLSSKDPLFPEVAQNVVQTNLASTTSIQRRYSIGFNRAAKLMDQMEAAGIVGPNQGSKPRQVIVDSIQLADILSRLGY